MINGITGRPGGGKSYEAVKTHVIPALEQRRKIITNLPLNVEQLSLVLGDYVKELIVIVDGKFHDYGTDRPFSKAQHFLDHDTWRNEQGQGVYFFIDECHLAMPSGSTEKELKEYLSMHRHYGHDIMLITQNFRKVDRDVRDMVNTQFRCIKKTFLGDNEGYLVKVSDGVSNNIVNTHHRKYEPAYFKFYKSHTKTNVSVQESTLNDVKKWYDHWGIYGAGIMLLILLYLLYFIATYEKKPLPSQIAAQQNSQSGFIAKTASEETQPNVKNNVTAQQPNVKNNVTVNDEPEEPKTIHPFYKVQLHISGWADYTDRGHQRKDYHLAASRNGQYLFNLSLKDLFLAGYDVVVMSDCMIRVKFNRWSDYLTCDSPQVSMSVFEDSNSTPNNGE